MLGAENLIIVFNAPPIQIKHPGMNFEDHVILGTPINIKRGFMFSNDGGDNLISTLEDLSSYCTMLQFKSEENIWMETVKPFGTMRVLSILTMLPSLALLMWSLKLLVMITLRSGKVANDTTSNKSAVKSNSTALGRYSILVLVLQVFLNIVIVILMVDPFGIFGIYYFLFAKCIATIGLPIMLCSKFCILIGKNYETHMN
jgi:hypothetical protein